MKYLLIFALMLINFCTGNKIFAQQHIATLAFKTSATEKYRSSNQIEKRADALQIAIKIDSIQKVSKDGLQLVLSIKNNADSNVSIINPLDLLQVTSTNQAGVKTDLIDMGARMLDNIKNSGFRYRFKIEKVLFNGKVSPIDLNKEQSISISAKGSVDIFIGIDKVYPSDGYKDPFPKGKYILDASLTLIIPKSVPGKYRSLHTGPVMISYGL